MGIEPITLQLWDDAPANIATLARVPVLHFYLRSRKFSSLFSPDISEHCVTLFHEFSNVGPPSSLKISISFLSSFSSSSFSSTILGKFLKFSLHITDLVLCTLDSALLIFEDLNSITKLFLIF